MDKRKDWIVSIPDQSGFEWFETREEAEAYAVEAMTDILHDHGEALDGQAFVAVIVTHVCEVVDEDPSEDVAEDLQKRGLDYFVSGYRGRESAFMAKMAEERAEAVAAATAPLRAEIDRLRRRVAELEAAATALADAQARVLQAWPRTLDLLGRGPGHDPGDEDGTP